MAKLKLGPIADDKPVKLTIELPAAVHRDLIAYGMILGQETDQQAQTPNRLVPAMVERFMATDRGFAKARVPTVNQAYRLPTILELRNLHLTSLMNGTFCHRSRQTKKSPKCWVVVGRRPDRTER